MTDSVPDTDPNDAVTQPRSVGAPLDFVDASSLTGNGPVWGTASAELNATVLAWPAGAGQPEHVNGERDVALVVLHGSGTITIDGDARALRAGTLAIVPRGSRRSIVAGPDGLRCVTVHRRRGGLQIRGLAADAPGTRENL